jgi:hypothetical protein
MNASCDIHHFQTRTRKRRPPSEKHETANRLSTTISKPSIKKSDDVKFSFPIVTRSTMSVAIELGRRAWITLEESKGALCLAGADLDQLVFLPTGDAALTRRARKHSVLSAVVLKFSKARGRYERQGLLVEEQAL